MSEVDTQGSFSLRDDDLQALSEAQLRQLYDEEEVERFMSLFSAYVTEVRFSTGTASAKSAESEIGGPPIPPPLPSRPADRSLSEHIAYNYLLPFLPPASGGTPPFTLKRLSLTTQRLYLAVFPPYYAHFSDLAQLALWKDYQRSLRHCIIFWFLWFHDLLLPAFVFRIVYCLLRRRMLPYPTLKELQERRQETTRALKLGEAVQQQLSVASLGPVEMWRLFMSYKSGWKGKAKPLVSDTTETEEEESFRRNMLYLLDELADLHERVKNVFAWRRSGVSCRYLVILIVAGIGTLVLPAQYIAKLVYGFGGILFWHVTPIIAALPRADRTRVTLLLRDAPTDADYAMDLIANRIATGQDVGIASSSNQSHRGSNASASTDDLTRGLNITSREVRAFEDDRINWKKWGERVARGKALLEEGRQLLSTRDPNSGETPAVCYAGAEDTHTFLAQYTSFPGLITLTPSTLFFTSLTRTHARLAMPLDRLRGVRRSGLVGGISITWAPEDSQHGGEEREERFHWVGNRDELFTRLVGSDGGRRWRRI